MLLAAEHPLHDSYTQTHAIQPLFLVRASMVEHGRDLACSPSLTVRKGNDRA